MNLNDSEFESQLRALAPRPPGVALEERIAAELRTIAPRAAAAGVVSRKKSRGLPGWLSGFGWAFAGAAVALTAMALLDRLSAERATSPTTASITAAGEATAAEALEHTGSTEELVGARDEGVVLDGEEPVRQVHYYSVERHVWRNPQTGALVEIEIPREDVRLTPIAMQ